MPVTELSSLSLDLLKTLVVFEETGRVEETARRLGMTQAGVSLQLKKLEEQAGVPLFQPLGRKKALTEFARGLCRSIAPPLRDIDLRLQEASRSSLETKLQTLRIACRSELMLRLANRISFEGRAFYRAMPEKLSLQALKEGEVDVVVIPDTFHVDQPEFLHKKLFADRLCLIAPTKWTDVRTWSELKKDHEFLFSKPAAAVENSSSLMRNFANAFNRKFTDIDLRFFSEDWNSNRELVHGGLAWSLIPESSAKGTGVKIDIGEDSGLNELQYVAVVREKDGKSLLKLLQE
jgi:DNA-binding transcriptional LysR family regulator